MKRLVALEIAAALAIALGCAAVDEDVPAAESEEELLDAVEADPEHYAVEFENDVVQVIRITYGPGERSVMHSHPANCGIFLTDTRFTMTSQAGDAATDENMEGTVLCGDAEVHLPENVGSDDAEVILIALKGRDAFDSGAAGPPVTGFSDMPDAVTADPDHYGVEFENDLLRVLRIAYGPGESSVMHAHPANCAIFLTEQTARFTLPDGSTEEATDQPGNIICGDAEVHLPENIGDEPFELVLVEFKNRETFQ
jgi:quercetin dioxygenase-like cupin family protein